MTDQASKKSKRPKDDINWLAKGIVDAATADPKDDVPEQGSPAKNQAAVELGRRGGLKGGKARANALTNEQRVEIARKAALSRWKRDR